MTDLRNLELEEKEKERKAKERRQRQAFLQLLNHKVSTDELTSKTRYEEFIRNIKDEESFYGIIGQEPCSPRGMFLDIRDRLMEGVIRLKRLFTAILKQNPERFRVGLHYEEFRDTLLSIPEFQSALKEGTYNSNEWIANYLFKKLIKRQVKAIGKFVRFMYDSDIRARTIIEDLEEGMRAHKDVSYFESISTNEKRRVFEEFKSKMHDEELLKDYVIGKTGHGHHHKSTPKREELRRRDADDWRHGDIEEGEIKGVDLELVRRKRVSR